MPDKALKSLRVLDLTSNVAGPFCTKLLADWGAEVIKVEPPGVGDCSRRQGPYPEDIPHPEQGGLFFYLNSNKKSVTLNLPDSAGQQLCRGLAQACDVMVEDLPPGSPAATGLGFDTLHSLNPSLVMTSITPFGHGGPREDWRAEDITLCALSGLMAITGEADLEPLKLPGSQMLFQAGLHAATATMAAVLARDMTGCGQHVDISIYECAVSLLGETFPMYTHRNVVAKREGNRQPSGHPHTILPCQDGFIAVLSSRDEQWQTLVDLVGDPRLRDPAYATSQQRRAHAEEVDAILKPWLQTQKKRDLMDEAQSKRLPFGAVFNPAEVVQDPHLKSRSFFVEIDEGEGRKVRLPGSPVTCSRTQASPGKAPRLGEHNDEVLVGLLGCSRRDVARLRQLGVV